MKRTPTFKQLIWVTLFTFLSGCGTLQVSIDQSSNHPTPTPDTAAAATISALQTENAQLATIAASTPTPQELSLNLQSDSETIRLKLLYSYRNWSQLWVDAQVTHYAPDGTNIVQDDHQQLWVDQITSLFRTLIGPQGSAALNYIVSNGQAVLQMNLQTGKSESYTLAPFVTGSYNPSPATSDSIEPHPLSGQIGTPLSDALFPSGLAQRGGQYVPFNLDTTAGRPTLVVDWYREAPGLRVDRFWIDIEKGLILRWQNYTKGGGDILSSEYTIHTIVYDTPFPPDLFRIPPAAMPAFAQDLNGLPVETTPAAPVTPVVSQPDHYGELYFTLMAQTYPDPNLRLVRLPGSCVVGIVACPESGPEIIPGYPNKNFTILPLYWAPDGSSAVLTNPTNPQGWPTGLFKFDPDKLTWSVLVEKEYLEQLSWSPDGKWIAFQSSENNLHDLYLIHPDGSGLTNLTKGAYTGEISSFLGGGWLENGYLYAFGNPSGAKLYLANPENGQSKEFPVDFPPGKSQFLPSPDGKSIALVESSDSGHTVKIFNAGGKFVRQLASFQNISITLHSWSADSKKLAFNGAGDTTDTVFIVGVDGSDFRQIYTGRTIGQVIFSPDGQYVVIEDINETGERLYIYRLTKGEIRLLSAPGLNLADNWRAPSWRP